MKNRRSFLKMLGLGAVAAPVAAKLAVEAEAPADLWPTSRVMAPEVIAAQREINRLHSRALKILNTQETADDYGMRGWVDWAEAARRRG